MLAIERKNEILDKLRAEQRVLVSDLAEYYNVTEETIRRDLEKLEAEIAELEEKDAELQQQLCSQENMSDYELLAKLSREHEEVTARLAEAYDEWAEASEHQY